MATINYPGLLKSERESNRFGFSVARLNLDVGDELDSDSFASFLKKNPFKVVIVRFPNSSINISLDLSKIDSYTAIFADTLLYWETTLEKSAKYYDEIDSLQVDHVGADVVPQLVQPIFENYTSHYSVNPIFPRDLVLDGYVEWVTLMMEDKSAKCLVLRDSTNSFAAFAVTDFSGTVPDIKLAGVSPSHRRRGVYEQLIRACMADAIIQQYDRMAISTQAHNVTVMSTWSRLGWTPRKSISTIHLVRNEPALT